MNAPDSAIKHIFERTVICGHLFGMGDNILTTPRKGGKIVSGHSSYSAGYSLFTDPRIHGNSGTKVDVQADLPPDRYELFILGDGEKRVEYEPETRVPNAAMFTFNKEDHTLGNLLRAKLVKSQHVLFAGYQVPHPLFAVFKLRVQTDGEITPKEAVVQACESLVKELQTLDQEFTKEWELKKIAGAGGDI